MFCVKIPCVALLHTIQESLMRFRCIRSKEKKKLWQCLQPSFWAFLDSNRIWISMLKSHLTDAKSWCTTPQKCVYPPQRHRLFSRHWEQLPVCGGQPVSGSGPLGEMTRLASRVPPVVGHVCQLPILKQTKKKKPSVMFPWTFLRYVPPSSS